MEDWLNSVLSRIESSELLPPAYFANLDCDKALDLRDTDDEFDTKWMRAFEQLEDSEIPSSGVRSLLDEIRQRSFLAVSQATKQHEIASYVSDDFDLIMRAKARNLRSAFLDQLWAAYEAGKFPVPPL